jgi:hypothetical protein
VTLLSVLKLTSTDLLLVMMMPAGPLDPLYVPSTEPVSRSLIVTKSQHDSVVNEVNCRYMTESVEEEADSVQLQFKLFVYCDGYPGEVSC